MKTMRNRATMLILLAACILLSGCAYIHNRGNDLADIVDVGITVNGGKPQFGLFLDFFNITPLGWSNLEVTDLGLQQRQFGIEPYQDKSWGLLLWGEELHGAKNFNPRDPRQARPDQTNLTERVAYDSGIVSLATGESPPPTRQFFECNRGIHLGWIGLHLTLRPADLLDFILGLTTLDILDDDQPDTPIVESTKGAM